MKSRQRLLTCMILVACVTSRAWVAYSGDMELNDHIAELEMNRGDAHNMRAQTSFVHGFR